MARTLSATRLTTLSGVPKWLKTPAGTNQSSSPHTTSSPVLTLAAAAIWAAVVSPVRAQVWSNS